MRMKHGKTTILVLILLFFGSSTAVSQYYYYDTYFGKNKVQYSDFDWKIIETEHFHVYYYPGERQLALDAARMAERAYARLSRVLSYEIKFPIPLVVYASHSDFQETNISLGLIDEGVGGFTEAFKSRVVLPFLGSYGDFEHVLVHEVIHAFQYAIIYGGSVGGLVGNPFVFQPPLWFVEGMSEYLSVGMDNHTEMWLRDAALTGYLIPLDMLSYVGDIRVYRFGQSVLHFIGQRYGDEKIGEILQKAPLYKSIDRAIESSLGIDMEELSRLWLEDTRRRYLPQIAEYEKPSRYGKQLLNHREDRSNFNFVPSISPDGEKFTYVSDKSLYADMYVASTKDGRDIKKLVEGERSGDMESLRYFRSSSAWSSDGRFIAFVAKVGAEDALYIMDVEKGDITRKLTFGFDGVQSPTWSPDGDRIAFVGLDGGAADLFTVDLETENLRRLTDDRYYDGDPAWSPDGRHIAFTTDRGSVTTFTNLEFGSMNIALFDLLTEEIEILTSGGGKNINPVFSPEGRELAFISDRTGISNVYTIDLRTREVFRITNVLTGITGLLPESPAISWSSESNELIFSVFEGGGWNVYVMKQPQRFKTPVRPGTERETDGEILAKVGEKEDPEPKKERERPADRTKFVYLRDFYSDEVDTLTVLEKFETPRVELPSPLLPDTNDFTIRNYKLKFTPDYVSGGAAFASNIGFAGLTQVGFSDVLGNHNVQVAANFYRSIKDSDLFLLYWYLKHRVNIGVGVFQFQNNYILFQPTSSSSRDEFVRRTYRGFQVLASRPFSKFERVEFGVKGYFINDDIFQQDFFFPNQFNYAGKQDYFYMTPTMAYVHDNALWGSTGPIAGGRTKIEIEKTLDSVSDISYFTVFGDWRKYINIAQRYVFAVRVIGAMSGGGDPLYYSIGGPYTLRGYGFGALRGTRIALTNFEFRFPLIDQLSLGFPPITFRNIRGAFFFDMGGAWSRVDGREDFKPFASGGSIGRLEDLRAAYGFGMRINLGFFLLRYDIAQPTDLTKNLGGSRDYFSLGVDF